MADIVLYEPLNTLKPVAEGIWIVDGPTVSMAAMGMHVPFPTRMTVVRLAAGALWCHSPVAPDEALFAALDAIGEVRHLVSPNMLHYTHIAAWKRRYPQAIAWASPGVRERARKQHIEVSFDADLEDAAPEVWAADLKQLRFSGSRVMQEMVFFHPEGATLILTDLIENLEAKRLPPFLHFLSLLGGVLDPNGKAPLDWRMTFRRGRAETRAHLVQILAWRPQRVILAHGRCYLEDGEAELRRAFRWLA